MQRECRERFRRLRGLAISTCTTAVGGGETFPTSPAHLQPTILRIWQEAHKYTPFQTIYSPQIQH